MSTPADATVLHVEDDAANRQSLAWVLRAEGFRIVEAGTGADALRLLSRQQPDLILLDVRLPDMSGFEVCRRIKTDPATASIPVLQLSGHYVEPKDRVQGLETGADAYLMKPIDPRELVAHLRAMLRVYRAERAARAAARQWQTTFDAVSDGIGVLSPQGKVLRCNRALAAILGLPAEAIVGQSFAELYTRRGGAAAGWLAEGGHGEVVEVPFRGRWYRVRLDLAPDDSGAAAGTTLVWVDVTERREAERTLRAILETTADAVLVLDAAGTIRQDNPATGRLFGYATGDLIGRAVGGLLSGAEALGAALRNGHGLLGVPMTARRHDGSTFPAELNLGEMRLGPERLFALFVRDLTERNRLEEQLRQAVKMEAVGRLAGGIAHDFNNQLTVINGYTDLLLTTLPEDSPAREPIAEVRRSGEHAAALTRQLLAFSRKQRTSPQTLNLNAVLGELGKMLRRLLGADIELVTDLEVTLGPVRIDAGQVEQVLVNLAVNARDAMPQGGRLEIRTRNVAAGRAPSDLPPGPYVLLEVRDTGVGMSEEVRSRVFEPFFTTKGPTQGTGLGLATVYGIVEQSGGRIEVESAPGAGASFRVYLPRVEAPGRTADAAPAPPPMPRGSETVLLVDDEPSVRSLAATMLRSSGFTVLEAADVDDALRLGREHPAPIHVLVTDVLMPRLNGPQLAERIQPMRPGLRVVFISGYTDDAAIPHGLAAAGQAFLQKPFTPAGLAAIVRRVLDGQPLAG